MTFKEAISLYLTKYSRLAFGQNVPNATEDTALLDISVALAEMNNNYCLAEKVITLSMLANTDKYTVGILAANIPYDIQNITNFSLNNTQGTLLMPCSISALRGYTKTIGTPNNYCVYLNNSEKILEIDSYCDTNYTAIIYYSPKCDLYNGSSGDNTKSIWASLDRTKADYGGSLPIDSNYNNALIERALCEVFPDRLEYAKSILTEALNNKPITYTPNLLDYFLEEEKYLLPGQDNRRI